MLDFECKIHYSFALKYVENSGRKSDRGFLGQKAVVNDNEPKKPRGLPIIDDNGNEAETVVSIADINREAQHQFKQISAGEQQLSQRSENDRYEKSMAIVDVNRSPRKTAVQLPRPMITQQITEKSLRNGRKIIPRTFAYTLHLIDCKFNRRPATGTWQIRLLEYLNSFNIRVFEYSQLIVFFYIEILSIFLIYFTSLSHSEADSKLAIRNFDVKEVSSDLVELDNLPITLRFSTEKSRLVELINSKSCLLTLKGPRGFRAVAELDNENILSQVLYSFLPHQKPFIYF